MKTVELSLPDETLNLSAILSVRQTHLPFPTCAYGVSVITVTGSDIPIREFVYYPHDENDTEAHAAYNAATALYVKITKAMWR